MIVFRFNPLNSLTKAVYYQGQAYCYHDDIIYFVSRLERRILQSYNMLTLIQNTNISTSTLIPEAGFCITITDDGDALFVNGGWTNGNTLSTTSILNMSTLIWDSTTMPNMNERMFIFIE